MFFCFRKKARPYPAVYSEWIKEWDRMGECFLSEEDSALLKGGALLDKKYSYAYFQKDLVSFLEKQVRYFFQNFERAVQTYIEEADAEYLILVIGRYVREYERLLFFTEWEFLDRPIREREAKALKDKLASFEGDLVRYLDKLSLYTTAFPGVSLRIKRLMEV